MASAESVLQSTEPHTAVCCLLAQTLSDPVWFLDMSGNVLWCNPAAERFSLPKPGPAPHSLTPFGHSSQDTIALVGLDGTLHFAHMHQALGSYQGQKVRLLRAIAQDTTHHPSEIINRHLIQTLKDRQQLVDAMQRANEQLEAIIEVQSHLAQLSLDMHSYAQHVVDRLCTLIHVQSASVFLLEEMRLDRLAHQGPPHLPKVLPLSEAPKMALDGLNNDQIILIDQPAMRDVFHWFGLKQDQRLVLAPLHHSRSCVGLIVLTIAHDGLFTERNRQTLQLLTRMLSSALVHQRDYALNHRLLQERTRHVQDLQEEINRREASEQALGKAHERTHAILETSHEGFLSFDRHLCITDLNAEAAHLLGAPPETLKGRSMADHLLQEPFLSRLRLGMSQYRRHGRWPWLKRRMEVRLETYQNTSVIVEVSFSATGDLEEPEFHAFLHDISHRKRSELALLQQQRMLRAISDHLPASVLFVDLSGYCHYANHHARQVIDADISPAQVISLEHLFVDSTPSTQDFIAQARNEGFSRAEASVPTVLGLRRCEIRCMFQTGVDETPEGIHLVIWDIEDRWQEALRLRDAAQRDPLTGTLNRSGFMQEAQIQLQNASASTHALLYLDMDTFKPINDLYGHATGDEVLQVFAARLRACIREGDLIGRIGGDEFLILLRNVDRIEVAERIARDILQATRQVWRIQGVNLHATTSIGLALHRAGETAAEVVARADRALYDAKAAGRDTFRLA